MNLTYLEITAAAACVALAATPCCISISRRLGLLDLPHPRKVHQTPVPRTGGLAIAAAVLSVIAVSMVVSGMFLELGSDFRAHVITVLTSAGLLLIVGFCDDIGELSSRFKLFALVIVSIAACSAGVRVDSLRFVGHVFPLGWAAWPVSIAWLVTITVSINFIDGLDGLAAGICSIAAAVLGLVAALSGQVLIAQIAFALMGALGGFLVFNFHPARIFMGDSGSMFLGFLLGCCGLLESGRVSTLNALVLPALALSVPLLDLFLTMIRRGVIRRRSIFSAERGHIHHQLLNLGLGQRHVALLLYCVSVAGAASGLVVRYGSHVEMAGGLLLTIPLLVGVFRVAGSTRGRETIAAIRRNRIIGEESHQLTRAFEESQLRFHHVHDLGEWWFEVCNAASSLNFEMVEIVLPRRDGTDRRFRWSVAADFPKTKRVAITAEIPIDQRRSSMQARASVSIAVSGSLEMAGRRLTLFSRLMEEHSLAQLAPSPDSDRDRSRHRDDLQQKDSLHFSTARQSESSVRSDRWSMLGRFSKRDGSKPDGSHLLSEDGSADPDTEAVHPISQRRSPKIAIVHDFLYCYAGAERVLEQIIQLYPEADLFSLFDFLPPNLRGFLKSKPVKTSFIQKLPLAHRFHRQYLPLMPLAIEQLNFSAYDIVISSSYLVAKGVITRPNQLHICYCHTPVRFAWDLQHQYFQQNGFTKGPKKMLARVIFHYLRGWDLRTSNGVDVFVTNSKFVSRRVEKFYRRKSTVIYPPVDTEKFKPGNVREDFYLAASRMVPYKRMDLIVQAFSKMPDRRLIVVGKGPELEKLRALAGPNVRLVGHQSNDTLRQYMQMAKALIFAAEEDFGIVPVEVQACGTPVIAFNQGGVTESVVAGRTGIFFEEQSVNSLVRAVAEFETVANWDSSIIRQNAERFSGQMFKQQFGRLVQQEWIAFHTSHENLACSQAIRQESGAEENAERPDISSSVCVDIGLRPSQVRALASLPDDNTDDELSLAPGDNL